MTEAHKFWVQFMESQMVSMRSERILTEKELAEIEAKIESVRVMSDQEFEAFETRIDNLHRELDMVNIITTR